MTHALSAITRERMRQTAEATMADTCIVLRDGGWVADSAGGATSTETTVATVKCGLRSLATGQEQETASRLGWTAGSAIRLPRDTDVTANDRLLVNGTRRFEIGVVVIGTTVKTAICQEVGNAG